VKSEDLTETLCSIAENGNYDGSILQRFLCINLVFAVCWKSVAARLEYLCRREEDIGTEARPAQATETGANRPLFITIPAYANEVANERLDLPPVPSPPGSMLVNVMSVVDQVTSTVPLPVMLMMNALRAGELPDGVALLQIMPCSEHGVEPAGQRIFSLWQGPDVDAVAAAVEGLVGDDCTSTCFPVMEDHMYGVGRESVEEKTARLARKAGANILAFDKRVGISATVTAAAAATVTKVKSLSAPKQPKDGDGAEPDPNAAPDKTSLKYVQENVSKEFNQVNEKLLKPAAEATTKAATDTWNTVSTAVNGLFARKDEGAGANAIPVPPPSAVMGASAVDDVAVETKTIEEVVAVTAPGGDGDGDEKSAPGDGVGEIEREPPASPVPTSEKPAA